jgi:hypothetical protein
MDEVVRVVKTVWRRQSVRDFHDHPTSPSPLHPTPAASSYLSEMKEAVAKLK